MTVVDSIPEKKWMRGLKRISTPDELNQFVNLWHLLQSIQLNSTPDQIQWRFTSDGKYSSRSAYQAQFFGSHPNYQWDRVWKMKVEKKGKFFFLASPSAQAIHSRSNYQEGRPGEPNLLVVRTRNESMIHMVARCSYSLAVWNQIAQITGQ